MIYFPSFITADKEKINAVSFADNTLFEIHINLDDESLLKSQIPTLKENNKYIFNLYSFFKVKNVKQENGVYNIQLEFLASL